MTAAVPPAVSDADLDDLRARLARRRSGSLPGAEGWSRGIDAGFLDDLLARWAAGFDWRGQEARIRALPWALLGEGDSLLRVIHQRSARADAPVVVLLHGWPDSVLRFERVLPLLRDVHVVVPALPGSPFAPPLEWTGMSVTRIAQVVAEGLAELGHDRYTLSGGDVGGDVAELLAAAHADRVASLHLTNVSARHVNAVDAASLPASARPYLSEAGRWFRTEGGYIAEQSTRPNTLAVGLLDSPAGLAAWIGEKLVGWADTSRGVEAAFSRDELLTWISACWFTRTIGTSFSTYVEPATAVDRVGTPTLISAFAHDIKPAPRAFAERFVDLQEFVEHADGGHFGAWEQPAAYAADLARAVALGR